jgi:hypothetical protein
LILAFSFSGTLAVSSSREAGTAQGLMLLQLALKAMFEITTKRTPAARLHPPLLIFAMLGALTGKTSNFMSANASLGKLPVDRPDRRNPIWLDLRKIYS